MSSADLWEDDYPHGTVEGFDGGCRGGACPAAEVDMPCKRAKTLAAGDIRYNRLAAAGKTPAEIATIIDGHEAEQAKPDPAPKPKAPRAKRVTAEPPRAAVVLEELNEYSDFSTAAAVEEPAPEPPVEPETPAEVSIAGPSPTATISAGPTDDDPAPVETEPLASEVDTPAAAETATTELDPEPPTPDEETTVPLEPFAPLTTEKYTAGLNPAGRAFVLRSIREWARTHGFPGIPNRGRIPQAALAAFDKAHPDGLVPDSPTQPTASGIDAHVAQLREVRVWARANGWPDLGDRGIVDDEIREAYNAAHESPVALVNQELPAPSPTDPSEPTGPVDDVAGTPPTPEDVDLIVHVVEGGVVGAAEWEAVRERAGMPPRAEVVRTGDLIVPPEPTSQPIWGDVAVSEDVERARNIAVLLEGQNALLLEQLGAAHTITESCITHNRDLRAQLEEAHKDALQQETVLRIAESSNRLLQTHVGDLERQVSDLKAELSYATRPWWKRIL